MFNLRKLKKEPWLGILLWALMATMLINCGREHRNRRSHGTSPFGGADSAAEQRELSIDEVFAGLGMRSFDQINETMAVVTGVNPTTAAIQTVYTTVRTQLPSSNDMKSFLASHQVGVSKLAVEYCDALMTNAALRDQTVAGFAFASAPNQAFAASGRSSLLSGLMNKFWGVDLADLPDTGEATAELDSLITDLLAGENMGSAVVTANVAKGVCTAVLSSASVMVF